MLDVHEIAGVLIENWPATVLVALLLGLVLAVRGHRDLSRERARILAAGARDRAASHRARTNEAAQERRRWERVVWLGKEE